MTGTVNGIFEVAGDSDWFRVRFEAGKTYSVDTSNVLLLGLKLPDGTAFNPPVSYMNKIVFVAPVTGDYWVSATSTGGPSPLAYTITATEVADNTPASIATPLTLAVGGSTTVTHNTAQEGQDDWFAVNLTAGQSYFVSSDNLTETLYLTDASGQLIELGSHQLHFTATQSGSYFIGSYSGSGSTHTVSLEAVSDDRGEVVAAAGNLSVGGSTNGVWEVGRDSDWYAINLTAGESYKFAINSAASTAPAAMRIYDSTGNLVSEGVGGLVQPSAIFAPNATDTYYVSATGPTEFYNPHGNWSYSLTATALTGDLTDNVLTTGSLQVDASQSGTWQGTGDDDWFAMTLSAGQSYAFALTSNSSSVSLALYDAAGNQIMAQTGGFGTGDLRLAHTIATSGTYYLGVTTASGGTTYTVTSASYVDDLADNSGTIGVLTVGGTAGGVIEAVDDRDWFAVQLTAGVSYRLIDDYPVGVRIRDAQGNLLTHPEWGDLHFSPLTSDTYYLEASGSVGAYTVGIVQVSDDNRENMSSTGVVRTTVNGTSGGDAFIGTVEHELFQGLGGDDRFIAGAGFDSFVGGAGSDTIAFGDFAVGVEVSLRRPTINVDGQVRYRISQIENVEGSAFDDTIEGSTGVNLLDGGDGDDVLDGLSGNDTLIGGGDQDLLRGGAGADALNGGAGTDTADYSGNFGSIIVDLAAGTGQWNYAEGDSLTDIENVTGTDFDDWLTGDANANLLDGGVGNDSISGADGADTLRGGAGSDVLNGGAGIDTADYSGNFGAVIVNLAAGAGAWNYAEGDSYIGIENVAGTEFNDIFTGDASVNQLAGAGGDDLLHGGAGSDVLLGGEGIDTADYSGDFGAVIVDLAASVGAWNYAEGDSYSGIENVVGTSYNDVLIGNGDDNSLHGGVGADGLVGGAGIDTADYSGDFGAVIVNLAAGVGAWNYAEGDSYSGIENVTGTSFNDVLIGNGDDNSLHGGAGADGLVGGAGIDTADYSGDFGAVIVNLATGVGAWNYAEGDSYSGIENVTGTSFNDTLQGNDASNRLTGGAGRDTLVGGGGDDLFVFGTGFGMDMITDFAGNGAASGDRIQFGAGLFDDFADLMAHATQQGSDVFITLDAENVIQLAGVQLNNLASGDFLF